MHRPQRRAPRAAAMAWILHVGKTSRGIEPSTSLPVSDGRGQRWGTTMVKHSKTAVAAALAVTIASPALAYDFSDTEVGYSYGWQYKEPGTANGANILQHNFYLNHVDGYSLGTNFVGIDITKWGPNNPAVCAPCSSGGQQDIGSAELYSVWRTSFSGNKVTKSSMFTWGPIKDISWEMGADLEVQNTSFGAEKRLIVAGPQFSINIPKGFWNISLHISKEWNNNGFFGATNFDAAPELETQWLYPIEIGPVSINFTGFLNIVGPKGVGGGSGPTSTGQTRTEILAHPKFLVDVGALAFNMPGKLEAGVGFEYWLNKFGDTTSTVGGGTHQKAVFFETDYHF
jgi:hypothetical protein